MNFVPRILAIAGVILLLCGCAASPPPAPANVEFDNALDGAKITVKRGGELKVILDSNPTSTGFQWQTTTPIAPVLSPIGERIWVPKGDLRAVGAAGINVFRFRAEQAGTLTLQFDYKRPWETVPPDKSVRYTVTVE